MARQVVFDFDLGGSTRRLNFGMACWEFFCERMNVPPADILASFTGPTLFKAVRMVVYSAIASHDYLKGSPPSVTEIDVANWLNEDPGLIQEIFTIAVAVLAPEVQDVVKNNGQKKSRSHSGKSKK